MRSARAKVWPVQCSGEQEHEEAGQNMKDEVFSVFQKENGEIGLENRARDWEERCENRMIYVYVHMREWEAKFWIGNWFGFFIDYKLKLQAIINNLSLDHTCYTELLTHLYKMSCKAVARHKFCEAYGFQPVTNFL